MTYFEAVHEAASVGPLVHAISCLIGKVIISTFHAIKNANVDSDINT